MRKSLKKISFLLFCLFITLLFSCFKQKSNNNSEICSVDYKNKVLTQKKISKKFQGIFATEILGDETVNGTEIISYNFKVSDTEIILTTETYHSPIYCNGTYRGEEKNNTLYIYYDDENKNCFKTNNNFNFQLKREKNKYYIKGIGGEATYNSWTEIKKIK